MELIREFESSHQLLDWLINSKESSNYYFRGICKNCHLYPPIMRQQEKDLVIFEDHILNEFSKYGSSLMGGISNAFDLISYAQHFGLPTRLVDWTRNPLVALFFALYNANTPDCENPRVLFLPCSKTMPVYEPTHLISESERCISYSSPIRDYQILVRQIENGEFAQICTSGTRFLDGLKDYDGKYEKKVIDNDNRRYMIIINTGYSNQRVLAQDGLFYLPRNLDRSLIDIEYASSQVRYISINPDWRKELLDALERVGISEYRLFFDLASITKYVVDKAVAELEELDKGFAWADLQED